MLQQSFDASAQKYDVHFTHSYIGKAQRNRVYKYLTPLLEGRKKILEVNCGTGEDAIYFASLNKEIIATDISSQMIEVAKLKTKTKKINFQIYNATEIDSIDGMFDIVFSNFGGLNCLNESELIRFFTAAEKKLNKKGSIVAVFLSSNSLLEKIYFKIKGKEFRRKENTAVETFIDKETFNTFYYSPDKLKEILKNKLKVVQIKPIGLFIPPSYMENKIRKRKLFFKFLVVLESIISNFSWQANSADHFYIVFEKKDS